MDADCFRSPLSLMEGSGTLEKADQFLFLPFFVCKTVFRNFIRMSVILNVVPSW